MRGCRFEPCLRLQMGVNVQSRVFFRCPYSNPKRLENAKSGTVATTPCRPIGRAKGLKPPSVWVRIPPRGPFLAWSRGEIGSTRYLEVVVGRPVEVQVLSTPPRRFSSMAELRFRKPGTQVRFLQSAPNHLATWQTRNASPLRGCPVSKTRKVVRVHRR